MKVQLLWLANNKWQKRWLEMDVMRSAGMTLLFPEGPQLVVKRVAYDVGDRIVMAVIGLPPQQAKAAFAMPDAESATPPDWAADDE